MKLPQIYQALNEPLILTPASRASLVGVLERHASGDHAAREGIGICGGAVDLAQAELIDGIMHIPITGPLGRGLDKFEKGAGCTDYGDIEEDIEAAEEDTNCRGIIFLIDSPGGMYNGCPELADVIANCSKPTAAFVPGMCCSAAYWLASLCGAIYATKSADVGNVGVYCYLLDQSKQFADAGLKPVLVTSGDYKGMGVPGVSLTKDQLTHLQDRVNEMAQTFYGAVQSSRPDVQEEDLRGQCFKAPSALARGFIDIIVSDLEEVVALMS